MTTNKILENQLNISIKDACCKGLADGVFCGVSAAVSVVKNKIRHRGLFSGGWTRYDKEKRVIQKKTLFDLASLTKPLCTTLCLLHLINKEELHWDKSYLSLLETALPSDKQKITLRHLVSHSSGLPPYRPYFEQFPPEPAKGKTSLLIQKILEEPLEYSTGTISRYSDLGYILLGAIIEKKTGRSLEALYRRIITDPLQLSGSLYFLPLDSPLRINKKLVAATEDCPWRQKIMQGEVHDEHSWLMGGGAGHAGLFGNIEGVLTLCEALLDIWKDRGSHPAFSNTCLQQAFTRQQPTESWCLGFDTPTAGQSSSGKYFSSNSVGHLGFSGTSFWIDPEKDIVVVLLSNRIHPSRQNTKIRQFRPLFHDYLMEKILSYL